MCLAELPQQVDLNLGPFDWESRVLSTEPQQLFYSVNFGVPDHLIAWILDFWEIAWNIDLESCFMEQPMWILQEKNLSMFSV